MLVYHGSDHIIEKPEYGLGRDDCDYGRGFYTTKDKEKAYSWACLYGNEKSICNNYSIDLDNLTVVNLTEKGVLAWIAEVIANRGVKAERVATIGNLIRDKYKIDTTAADVLIGYRADDSYTEIIEAFLDGYLTIEEVEKLFYKGELGEQVFIKSQKAFDMLEYKGYEEVIDDEKYLNSDRYARRDVAEYLKRRRDQYSLGIEVKGLTAREVVLNNYNYEVIAGFGHYIIDDDKLDILN